MLDIKAQRHTAYDGGPSDTGFSLMVDVQVGWRDAHNTEGGAKSDEASRKDTRETHYVHNERTLEERERMLRRVVEAHNA